jgi:PAS domain S-box-containing protein
MKIHTKINLLLVSVTTIFLALLFVFLLIRSSEVDLYLQSKLQSDAQVAQKVLEFKAAGYLQTTRDNAAWDGMLDFSKTLDTTWAAVTMGSTYQTFGFDHYAVYDTLGNCLYSVNYPDSAQLQLSPQVLQQWFSSKRIVHHFLIQGQQLWEVFGCVIVPTADLNLTSKANGFLITAICWDTAYVAELSTATGFEIEKRTPPVTLPKSSSYFDDLIFTRDLEDSQGKPVCVLTFKAGHPYSYELSYLKYLGIVMIGGSILSLLIFIFLVSRWIAFPLKAISTSLEDGQLEPIQRFLKQKQGFGEIARLIKRYKLQTNDMLAEVNARTIAEDNFRAVFETNPAALAILDPDTKIHMVNDAFCARSTYDRSELINKSWTELIPEEDRARMLEYNRRRILDPQSAPDRYEFRFVKKDGSISRGNIIVNVILRSGQIVVVFSDIQ